MTNTNKILDALLAGHNTTVKIAKNTGIKRSSVSSVLIYLGECGVIHRTGSEKGESGRNANTWGMR